METKVASPEGLSRARKLSALIARTLDQRSAEGILTNEHLADILIAMPPDRAMQAIKSCLSEMDDAALAERIGRFVLGIKAPAANAAAQVAKDTAGKIAEAVSGPVDASYWKSPEIQGIDDPDVKEALQALEKDPNVAEPHVKLGVRLVFLDWKEEAVIAYRRALEIDPRRVNCNDLANLLKGLGQYKEAIDVYKCAIERGDRIDYWSLGGILVLSGQYEEAVNAYKTAIQNKPHDIFIYLYLGRVLANLGRNREALDILEAGLKLPTKGIGRSAIEKLRDELLRKV